MDPFAALFKPEEHRKTDTKAKSIWWSVTAFGEEIALCEGTLPEYVRTIYGGREKCPSTGTEHFQGAIQCYEQVRMAKFKSWLKRAHLEPARSNEALKKYAMKTETSIGEKTIRPNTLPHYSAHELCTLIGRQTGQTDFWPRVRKILKEQPGLAGQLMNPSLRNFYEKTQDVWVKLAREEDAIVLQHPLCEQFMDCQICECENECWKKNDDT